MRRAVGGALDATVGRVGHTVTEAAMDVTGATAQQVIEDLEPYLIQEAIPRIVDGLTPYLTDKVVPEVLEGITDHLVADTVPDIVDGVTAHLVAVTVPQVVDGVTPRLVADLLPKLLEDLRPYLEAELVPRIVEGLLPYIQEQVAPELIDGLMPKIRDEVAPQLIEALMPRIEEQIAPQLIDALMPRIRDDIAPQLVDALMPKITDEVAPQLVDALMPKIRTEVVPLILDDIVDDPAVRDLIREQSQGLFLDAIEGFRGTLADADNLTERVVRKVFRRPPRPKPESGLQLVLAEESEEDTKPLRLAVEDLATQRALWRAMPVHPAPPGRSYMYAGAATRLLGVVIDLAGVGYITAQVLATTVSLLESLFGELPQWLTAAALRDRPVRHPHLPVAVLLGPGTDLRHGGCRDQGVHSGRAQAGSPTIDPARLGGDAGADHLAADRRVQPVRRKTALAPGSSVAH